MSGRNRYLDVQSQYRNLHEAFVEKRASVEFDTASRQLVEPCIFLSHRSTDKTAVREIGEYIRGQGIDIYLDADDPNLQRVDLANDHKAITAAIELGIANSTDLLAYLTTNTATSPWVPYEVGFAKRNGNFLAAMKSNDLARLPSYLEIVRQITGIKSLNDYLKEVLTRDVTTATLTKATRTKIAQAVVIELRGISPTHPLAAYLSQH